MPGGPAAPAAAPPAQGRGRGAKRAAGPPLSPCLARSHRVHSTPQCPQMGVMCARLGPPHPKDMQEHECARGWALHGASPTLGAGHPFAVGMTGSMLCRTAEFQEEVPISMNGLGNSSKEWQRFKLLHMSMQWVCQHLRVVTVGHHEVG